jgi:PAS domain S-box-containing protein
MNLLVAKPTGVEIKIKNKKLIFTKTDIKGDIVSVSDTFIELSGYSANELVGSAHNIIRHPDMPQTIFRIMWSKIRQGKNVKTIIKSLAKNGNHFWLSSEIEIKKDSNGETRNYIAYRKPVSQKTIKELDILYKKLRDIESVHGIEAGIDYLNGYLDENKMSYCDLIISSIKAKDKVLSRFINLIKTKAS